MRERIRIDSYRRSRVHEQRHHRRRHHRCHRSARAYVFARSSFRPSLLPILPPVTLRASFSSCRSQRERARKSGTAGARRREMGGKRDGVRSADTCSSPARKTDKGRVRARDRRRGNRGLAGGGKGNERRQRRCQRDDETKQRENGSRTRYGSQELSPVSSEITGSQPRAHVNVPPSPPPPSPRFASLI